MALKLDHIDKRLLIELQRDSSQSQRDLAERVGLSQNACWRRLRALDEAGAITRRTVVLDRDIVGAGLVVIMMIRSRHHSAEWLKIFQDHVDTVPEVVDFYRIGGEYDYLLKIVTRDMASYDTIYRALIAKVELDRVTSFFVMEAMAEQRPLRLL